jgi:predicted PurR-regulated permease PerM
MKKLNYKLVNALIVVVIIFLVWLMKDLWGGILGKIFDIVIPFVIAFAIAYVLHPLLLNLQSRGVPKAVSLIIISLGIVLFIGLILWLLIPNIMPILFDQTTSLFSSLIKFIQDLSSKYDINLIGLKDAVSNMSSDITSGLGKTISTGFINIISQSLGIISKVVIIIIVAIYFLLDMQKIRDAFEAFLKKRKNKETLKYFQTLDDAIHNYVNAFATYALVMFIQYTVIYYLIGHPNYLLLGILAALGILIPYFGGVIANIIAIITASVISSKLMILTLIVSLILPNVDGYFTSPRIYKKSNQLPALLSIFAVFTGGALAGIIGIILALPITIILLTTYKFYRNDIAEGIAKITDKNKD